METKVSKEDLIYLYCITNNVPKLKDVDALADNLYPHTNSNITPTKDTIGAGVYFIYHQGLYAIVNKVKEFEFGEENLKRNLADLEWIKAKANIHENVIEGIMKNACVIPFKFATLFNTADNLKTMLDQHLEEFKSILKKLEDKEEWGVKIYCDCEKLNENLLQENKELLNLDREIKSSLPGKAYLLKKKKEELLDRAATKKLNEYGQASFDTLRENSPKARINKLLPKEVTERNDEMILNSVFLIDKDKVEDFLNIVEDLRTKYTDKGLFFDCTGPWPPYNFCNFSKEKIHNG